MQSLSQNLAPTRPALLEQNKPPVRSNYAGGTAPRVFLAGGRASLKDLRDDATEELVGVLREKRFCRGDLGK
jgi:hypothetical protein